MTANSRPTSNDNVLTFISKNIKYQLLSKHYWLNYYRNLKKLYYVTLKKYLSYFTLFQGFPNFRGAWPTLEYGLHSPPTWVLQQLERTLQIILYNIRKFIYNFFLSLERQEIIKKRVHIRYFQHQGKSFGKRKTANCKNHFTKPNLSVYWNFTITFFFRIKAILWERCGEAPSKVSFKKNVQTYFFYNKRVIQ